MSEKANEKSRKNRIEVPVPEEVNVYDLGLKTFFIGIIGSVTLAAISYTYYMKVKSDAEKARISAIAESVSSIASEIATVIVGNVSVENPEIRSAEKQIKNSIRKSSKRNVGARA